jgi:AraC-like DNA-binding protein
MSPPSMMMSPRLTPTLGRLYWAARRSPWMNRMRNRRRTELIRIGGAAAAPEILHDFGVDAIAIAGLVGLNPETLADPENVIPFVTFGRLMHECVSATGCEHFGLLVGQRGSTSSLGFVGLLAEHSPNVRAALDNLVRYYHIHDGQGVPILGVGPRLASIGYAIFENSIASAPQIIDAAIATKFNIMRRLCGSSWRPIEIILPRPKPQTTEHFDSFFDAPVRFGAEYGVISFSTDCLEQSVPDANALIRGLLEDRIGELNAKLIGNFETQLRRLLRTLILARRCSFETVAQLFNLGLRALRRCLDQEKIKFREIVGEVRFELARDLLADTSLTMTQIATMLDYSDATAFTRAFRCWSGAPPMHWRADHSLRGDASE